MNTRKISEMTKAVRENGMTDESRALIREAFEVAKGLSAKQLATTTPPKPVLDPQQPTDSATEARKAMIDRTRAEKNLHLNPHSGDKSVDVRNLAKE